MPRTLLARFTEAIRNPSGVMPAYPAELLSDQDIAESLMQSKNYEDAIPHLERARRQQPGNTAVVLMLAECYDRNGQKQQAAACYRSVEPTLNDASQAVSLRRAKERYAVLRASGY